MEAFAPPLRSGAASLQTQETLPEKIPPTKPIIPTRSYALILTSNPIPLAPLPVPPLLEVSSCAPAPAENRVWTAASSTVRTGDFKRLPRRGGWLGGFRLGPWLGRAFRDCASGNYGADLRCLKGCVSRLKLVDCTLLKNVCRSRQTTPDHPRCPPLASASGARERSGLANASRAEI